MRDNLRFARIDGQGDAHISRTQPIAILAVVAMGKSASRLLFGPAHGERPRGVLILSFGFGLGFCPPLPAQAR